MDAGTIEKIESMALQNQTVEIDGQAFSQQKLEPVIFTPIAETLTVHTLKGFCEYINNVDFDKINKGEVMAIVESETKVKLVSSLIGKDRVRETIIEANLNNVETFLFGSFFGQEEFAIKFRSLFVPNSKNDTDYVLKYASKLSGGTNIDLEDDGITQSVGVKKGLSGALVSKESVKPIVRLTPYRTFREIEQVESEFLFRTRLDSENVPNLALFEADGSAWRLEAVKRIAGYIAKECPDLKIIA
ncbi:hypothetical protein [Treponema pectinovorum]|uniref:hypothetical protein n=1 Tax=Treponema pectinovorum TaxID=164 RepID=UPI0011CC0106|nr:hypothetical protein [Treponema pectinovorum]